MSGTLLPGTDPILLCRIYPEEAADSAAIADLEAEAVAAGAAVAEAGALIEASQQEPVAGSPDDVPPAPPGPPVNVDVPAVTQTGATLNCTTGNWTGEPTSYAYQWQIMGVDVGTNSSSYAVQSGDIGETAVCVVTASNAAGSTTAPPSVGVVVT